MKNLKGKSILFLSASFFSYQNYITNRLQELGASVDFFDERPSNSTFAKGIIRVNPKWYFFTIQKYYQQILKQIEAKNYDYLLLIKGETVPEFFLEKFRTQNPNALMIFYAYDAVSEYPKITSLFPYFDKIITFEPEDARKYQMNFRPLFFINDYVSKQYDSEPKWDVVFVGSAHTDRYLVGKEVEKQCKKNQLKTQFYYFAPNKLTFLLKKIWDQNFKKFGIKDLNFKNLTHQEIVEVYLHSKTVLDINKPFQNGITIRTFEVLALGKKLITTNKDIVNYPFYHPNNILVIDRKNPEIPLDFFLTSFEEMNKEILYKMSLDSWIEDVFLDNQNNFWHI